MHVLLRMGEKQSQVCFVIHSHQIMLPTQPPYKSSSINQKISQPDQISLFFIDQVSQMLETRQTWLIMSYQFMKT